MAVRMVSMKVVPKDGSLVLMKAGKKVQNLAEQRAVKMAKY